MRFGKVKVEGSFRVGSVTEVLTGNIKLTSSDETSLYYDPNGFNRLIELPDIPSDPTELAYFEGICFNIRNIDTSTNTLTVQDDALNTLAVLDSQGTNDGQEAQCTFSDGEWHVIIL